MARRDISQGSAPRHVSCTDLEAPGLLHDALRHLLQQLAALASHHLPRRGDEVRFKTLDTGYVWTRLPTRS